MLASRASTFDLAARPLLAQRDGAAIIEADDVEPVLTDIDADYGNRSLGCRRHGVLLVLAPLARLSLAGQEHGRTIPLAVIGLFSAQQRMIGHQLLISAFRNAPSAFSVYCSRGKLSGSNKPNAKIANKGPGPIPLGPAFMKQIGIAIDVTARDRPTC
jgi:hypothetical protein